RCLPPSGQMEYRMSSLEQAPKTQTMEAGADQRRPITKTAGSDGLESAAISTTMKKELKELLRLTEEIAVYDATLAADPTIEPSQESLEGRRQKEQRKAHLLEKYELIGR